jgi:hypothetical protein
LDKTLCNLNVPAEKQFLDLRLAGYMRRDFTLRQEGSRKP